VRDRFVAFAAALNRIGAAVACVALGALIVLITLQVIRRRLLDAPIVYTDEVSGYLLVVVTFLSLGYALQHGDHIQVELLTGRLSSRHGRWVRIGWCLVGLGFTGLLTVRSAALALDSARLGAFSITSQIPLAPIQAVAPLGFSLLFLQLAAQLVETLWPPR
jgi:TRAP-type C4-dicarboxylate transport system permease small subunit